MTRDTKKAIILGLILGLILFLAFVKLSSWSPPSKVANIDVEKKITLIYKDKTWQVTFRDLGFTNAEAKPRQSGGLASATIFDEEKLNQFIKENLASCELPAKDAGLKILELEPEHIIRLIPSQEGLEVNRTLLKLEIKENLAYLKNNPIEVKFIISYPRVKNSEVAQARMNAYRLLETPINLEYENQKWKIPTEEIVEWIEFVKSADSADFGGSRGYQSYQSYWPYKTYPSYETYSTYPLNPPSSAESANLAVRLDTQAIKTFITPLATEINEEPINARLSIKNNKVVAFALSRDGKRLEIEESAQIIADNADLGGLRGNPPESAESATIELAVSTLTPQVTTESIDNLGITTLIGKGESNFAGSPKNRIYNIKLSAARFNGTLIKPAEEFSFNETLGEVGPTSGYLPELVIKRDKTIPEFGGGICQVSTTLFRAALFSGLPITERFPHAFPVAYYYPQGMDATVYPPHPDLRFKNDTPGHILIQRKIIGTRLIFELFGTSEVTATTSEVEQTVKRSVKIKGPYVIEKKEDGSMKTVLYREIYHDGELVKKETFWSSYASPEKYPREE